MDCSIARVLPSLQEIVDILPQTSLTIIPNCGHTPHIERPEEVAAAIIDFVGKISAKEA